MCVLPTHKNHNASLRRAFFFLSINMNVTSAMNIVLPHGAILSSLHFDNIHTKAILYNE